MILIKAYRAYYNNPANPKNNLTKVGFYTIRYCYQGQVTQTCLSAIPEMNRK